jgi:8-oxo-dGTP pyrophosphatase MutT (NUDIX family)
MIVKILNLNMLLVVFFSFSSFAAGEEENQKDPFTLSFSLQENITLPCIETAGCYCEFENQFLFLKRHPNKSYGDTWCIPGGKLDEGETPIMGVIREVYEETGISINPEVLQYISPTIYALNTPNGKDFVFHRFWAKLSSLPSLSLDLSEHTDARWVTIFEILHELPLMDGGKEALIDFERFRQNSES